MLEPLPERFLAADPSRSWILYWTLAGLTTLGEDVSGYRHRLAQTARGMQNPTGGFGGGGGQLSHLATTYAVVLALALVGGEEAYEVVDREGLWRWLCSLKQKDGGFQVCLGGEEDIRGAYCAAVIITLLNLPLELTPESPAYTPDGSTNLLSGLADYVRRCQTFEGGISGQPNVEAHGAYAFCALGCLSVLGDPRRIIPEYLDIPRLTAWLSSRQYAPEGGFSGRTNKLIDGCYSHWVGGCFPLIEAALGVGADGNSIPGSLPPPAETLFSREGLTRYILCCCQDQTRRGGLRDKPGKMSDAYHTCYVLAGLSSAQHQWELSTNDTNIGATLGATGADAVWNVLPYLGGDDDLQVFEREDLVRPVHPVYAIPLASKDAMRSYFLAKGSSFDDDGAAATAPGE
ncbi:terpenoid cyclases/protein prenyltransferase alpha-alpha toroid [Echria macrotheca]|uniref:Protein farnesyltransferase subunit beta n=1 Tax=Echria macrotheca TaxID=438768 RepID=A0AAJ0BMG6_9PEZI|nr:terpenoid cyclases/protein prenyltransferase alpha-alpha toroid [Echria macrotheca]